jgi:hypothetical protein
VSGRARPRRAAARAVAALLLLGVFSATAAAHEPIFGLGPHTIYKGGLGVEAELEGERASGAGETEKEILLVTELLYGVTADLSVTLAAPAVLAREVETDEASASSAGLGDASLRAKYRFWRRDRPGLQDAAAAIVEVKLPTGDPDESPRLGTGSTDFLFGLAAGRESLRWYYFGDLRYRLNTEGEGDLRQGDRFFADAAVGIRPWPARYLRPDLVLLAEINAEVEGRAERRGTELPDSGGRRLFVSPGFFLTYRNWALKGGVQIPLRQDLNGDQPEEDYRFALALEVHL